MSFAACCFWGGWELRAYSQDLFKKARESENWKEIPATVTKFEIVRVGSGKTIDLQMTYEYEVGAQAYEGNRITMGGSDNLKELPKQPKNGETIAIFYDPEDPQSSTWVKGATGSLKGFVAASYVLLVFGLGLFILTLKIKTGGRKA